jgi:hypothetical protein
MESGQFLSHLSISGLSSSLATGSFLPNVLTMIADPDFSFPTTTLDDLLSFRYVPGAVDQNSMMMELLGAGVLSLARVGQDPLKVKMVVPNDDTRYTLTNILLQFARGLNFQTLNQQYA